jgi:hypothetical protein
VSIGKPVLFEFEDDFAIDSHIAILRPAGMNPKVLVYLLASPLGQVQFQRAESGASGQTGVSEEDIRRFRFPVLKPDDIQGIAAELDTRLIALGKEAAGLRKKEADAWTAFNSAIVGKSKKKRG